jgi:hypothetical protein
MPGNASNIPVLLTGDVYLFDPVVAFVEATHLPADVDDPLHASWLPLGLMKGTPGVKQPRDIDKTDVMSWQQGRVLTRYKNGKMDANFNLLERNANVLKLINPTKVPRPVLAYLAFEYLYEDTGKVERWFTAKKAHIWVPADDREEEINGTDIQCSLYPDDQDLYTLIEGIPA